MNPSGSALVYSTYLGGSGTDRGSGIAVDSAGNAYVTGYTESRNFPKTPSAVQRVCNGGSECGVYGDAFVTKFNPIGSALVYSTYLGGSGTDVGQSIAVNSAGNAYVTGYTQSTDFPITPGAFQTVCNGGSGCTTDTVDAFVTKIQMAFTNTTLTSSPNPSAYRQGVTFTAVATSALGAPPDGETVTFKKGSITVLGTAVLSGGSASFTTSTLPVGGNLITAVYGGDSNFAGSKSKAVNQVVSKAATTTTLVSSRSPSSLGQSVTFTATVTLQFGGTVKGTVSFYDGTTLLKTVSLSGGVAKFTTSTLTSGTHTMTATYNGSTNFIGSSGSVVQTVE